MSMFNCICPYCDKSMDDPDDCYEEGVDYQEQCPHCEKNFTFTIGYTRNYYAEKADCLNGGEHNYKKTMTIPEQYARLQCTMCGDEKPLPKTIIEKEVST
jgi:hypothetical protein